MSLLNRVANYFKEWDGHEEDTPKMELSVDELREISSIFVDGIQVLYDGDDESDGIHCPCCTCEVARNDDYEEMKPKHCPECGTKLSY